MREMQNQWSLLRCVTSFSFQWRHFRAERERMRALSGEVETTSTKTHSKLGIARKQQIALHLFFSLCIYILNKCASEPWQEHRGESRWSPFHRIPCGNFRGLFPNPFKWTFHLSASSSVSAIPTVQPFLHHFLHNLARSPVQNKCLWEIWFTHTGKEGRRPWKV